MFPTITKTSAIKQFQVTSGALRVTDPCYATNVWCSGKLTNVRNGEWNAHVGYRNDESVVSHLRKRIDEATAELDAAREDIDDGLRSYWSREKEQSEKWLEEFMGRVAYLHIGFAADSPSVDFDPGDYILEDVDVGVDSGQAGFFDLERYEKTLINGTDKNPDFEKFYTEVCQKTSGIDSFAEVEFGVASSSGYGDGSYECYTKRDADGVLVGAFIIFIGEEDESE